MKFFVKRTDSPLLAPGIRYGTGDNRDLRERLLSEQRGYCAYTEKRVDGLDSCDIEHFDTSLKDTPGDDYYNWYATLHSANARKRRKERMHRGATFFASRFFQTESGFADRVVYVPGDFVYEPKQSGDEEAGAFVDFVGLNDNPLVEERRKHIQRLRRLFDATGWDRATRERWIADHPDESSFVTALEAELGVSVLR